MPAAGVWLAVLAALGFSAKAIFVKLAYAAAPVEAVTLLALRMAFSLPVFLWVGLRESRSARPLTRRDCLGLQYITAGLERLILFTYPTMTLLLGAMLYGHRIGRREWIAVALCYAGIAAAFTHDLDVSAESAAVWIGGGLVFGSSLSYAFYLSGSGPMLAKIGVARFTALAMLVSTAAVLGHFVASQPLAALVQPLPVYAYALAMALFSTVIPVFAHSAAIRRIGSGRAALIGTVGPLMTIALGWWWLGESISTWQLLGAALVVAGVVIVGRGRT